jgi:hypothetical protein
MTPDVLLTAAVRLLDQHLAETEGLWARAAAILARQALEGHVRAVLAPAAPGAHAAPFTTQLLLLRELHPDKPLAARAAYTWAALSEATHHHGYELAPTAATLRPLLATISTLLTTSVSSRRVAPHAERTSTPSTRERN